MILATLTVWCDWCRLPITAYAHGAPTAPVSEAQQAAAHLEARTLLAGRAVLIPAPTGHAFHLCKRCEKRGSPPATNAGHQVRQNRERAEERRLRREARQAAQAGNEAPTVPS